MLSLKFRSVVPGGAGGAMATPDFGRSVNPISTRGTPNYYVLHWHPRILRPYDGPGMALSNQLDIRQSLSNLVLTY